MGEYRRKKRPGQYFYFQEVKDIFSLIDDDSEFRTVFNFIMKYSEALANGYDVPTQPEHLSTIAKAGVNVGIRWCHEGQEGYDKQCEDQRNRRMGKGDPGQPRSTPDEPGDQLKQERNYIQNYKSNNIYTPRKTVNAQKYEQRDYSEVQGSISEMVAGLKKDLGVT